MQFGGSPACYVCMVIVRRGTRRAHTGSTGNARRITEDRIKLKTGSWIIRESQNKTNVRTREYDDSDQAIEETKSPVMQYNNLIGFEDVKVIDCDGA